MQLLCAVFNYFFSKQLLASKGVQRGTDRQGLLGFLLYDIKKEINRGSRIVSKIICIILFVFLKI